MKSKKIILGIAIVAILVVGGIALSMSSKNSNKNSNESTTSTETNTDSKSEQAANEDKSNSTATSDPTNNENTDANTSNSNNPSKDLAASILNYYLGEENVNLQNITPISLENNVAKKQDSSNIFFSDKEELTDATKTGVIIILDNYDEASKTYKYTLRDYFTIKEEGDIGTGTVKTDGSVTEDDALSEDDALNEE